MLLCYLNLNLRVVSVVPDFHYFPFHFPQIGRFFGAIDPILMRNLVNSSLFTFKKTFDYQSLCHPKKESKAAAGLRSVYVVSYISQRQFAHLPQTHKATHFCTPVLIYPRILISTLFSFSYKNTETKARTRAAIWGVPASKWSDAHQVSLTWES